MLCLRFQVPSAGLYGSAKKIWSPELLSHFFALIMRQHFPQRSGDMPKFLREASSGTPRIGPAHSGQNHRVGYLFSKGSDSRLLRAPLMRSPSQWTGSIRVITSAGQSAVGVMLGSRLRWSAPRARGQRACPSDPMSPIARSQGSAW